MQVLLCGTNYGSSYLAPLIGPLTGRTDGRGRPTPRLCGILGRGSGRSRALAAQAGVPFYDSLGAVPPGAVEAAVTAVPGPAGVELVHRLLARGIHVLAEHPWEPHLLESALSAAAAAGRVLHVNSHFADLASASCFLAHSRWDRRGTPAAPRFVTASGNPRTLYSLVELVGRALGGLTPWEVPAQALPSPGAFLASLTAVLGGVPATVLCQRQASIHDDGSATLLNHQVQLGFSDGTLLLGESFGPVLWIPRALPGLPASQPAWTSLYGAPPGSAAASMTSLREEANRDALERWAEAINGGPAPGYQHPDHLLAVARVWRALLNRMGPVETVAGL